MFKAYKIVLDSGYKNIKLHIIGSGPQEKKLKKLDKKLHTNIIFYGRVSYKNVISILNKCDLAVNLLVKDSYGSLINKHADYGAAGLPVFNSQSINEYSKLVEKIQYWI